MYEFYPLLITGGVVGGLAIIFTVAYMTIGKQKEAIGFDRNMADSEITKRLLRYAAPFWKQFLLILLVMLLSVAYDIISPMIIGNIEEMIKADFPMSTLLIMVACYRPAHCLEDPRGSVHPH